MMRGKIIRNLSSSFCPYHFAFRFVASKFLHLVFAYFVHFVVHQEFLSKDFGTETLSFAPSLLIFQSVPLWL